MYGDGAIAERTARDWFIKFKSFYFKDAPRVPDDQLSSMKSV